MIIITISIIMSANQISTTIPITTTNLTCTADRFITSLQESSNHNSNNLPICCPHICNHQTTPCHTFLSTTIHIR